MKEIKNACYSISEEIEKLSNEIYENFRDLSFKFSNRNNYELGKIADFLFEDPYNDGTYKIHLKINKLRGLCLALNKLNDIKD